MDIPIMKRVQGQIGCKITNCNGDHYSKGFCRTHWNQQYMKKYKFRKKEKGKIRSGDPSMEELVRWSHMVAIKNHQSRIEEFRNT